MSNEWERREADKSDKRRLALLIAVEYGLVEALQSAGAVLVGFSVGFRGGDVLMTLRADFEGRRMIAFVGADGLGNLFIKAAKEASYNKLKWREDKYANDQT
jgi:hypothetical protein